MSTRNDRFNASMRSLDELTASFKDPSKAEVFPDKGLGVERMVSTLDYDVTAEERLLSALADKLFFAEMRLVDANRKYLRLHLSPSPVPYPKGKRKWQRKRKQSR